MRTIDFKGALTAGLRPFAAGAIALLVLGAIPERAGAGVVGLYADAGPYKYEMGLTTSSDDTKIAALFIRGPDPTKDIYKPSPIFFSDSKQWNQFAVLWKKARGTKPPKRTDTDVVSIEIGNFADSAHGALLVMSVNDNAAIEFSISGPDHRFMLFQLRPQDFDVFDGDMKKVGAYLGE